jgi:4-amino-4-deoxy-L-arabinose transferase-like glycosyltransferase
MSLPTILPPRFLLWSVFAAAAVLMFANLGSRDLMHPDEGRYGEIAREMVVSGDWVTPRLNGLKYFEKPPFQYWMTAAAFRAFGAHEWTTRLWPATAGLLAVLVIGVAGQVLGGAALGTLTALALMGMLWPAALAQAATLDSGLAFFLAAVFAAFVIAQHPGTGAASRRAWMWATWAAMAGATLSKGPIGIVLPAGALVAYTIATRDFALWRRLHVFSGLVLFLALTAPWFVAVSQANGEFLSFFFVHEHLQRFLTEEHQRAGSWYYFLPLAAAGSLPWLPILAYGAPRAWREAAQQPPGFSWQRLALVWAAFVLLFFSASGSKLPSYILPMFAPLALLTGWLLQRLEARTLFRLTFPGAVLMCAIAAAAFAGYGRIVEGLADGPQPVGVLLAFGPWVKGALAFAAAGTVAATFAFRRAATVPALRYWGVAALALSTLGSVDLAVAGFDTFSVTRSTSAILRTAQMAESFAPAAPFYQIGMYDQTLPFYLGRTTTLVAFRDELALGIDAEPGKQIPSVAAWVPQWQALGQGYAVLPPPDFERLAAEGVPMRVLARDSRRVIVSRR